MYVFSSVEALSIWAKVFIKGRLYGCSEKAKRKKNRWKFYELNEVKLQKLVFLGGYYMRCCCLLLTRIRHRAYYYTPFKSPWIIYLLNFMLECRKAFANQRRLVVYVPFSGKFGHIWKFSLRILLQKRNQPFEEGKLEIEFNGKASWDLGDGQNE